MKLVSQSVLQKRGGKCARAPVSCLILDMVREVGVPLETWFDATYGEGRFYITFRPRVLVGADVRVLEWRVKPDAFILAPVWASWRYLKKLGVKPDVYVLDPPWQECVKGNGCRGREWRGRYHYRASWAIGSPEVILREGVKAAERLGARYLIVHWREEAYPEGWRLLKSVRFKPFLPNVDKYGYTSWFGILVRDL